MPRIARINVSSLLYHIVSRFVDGRFEFDTQLRHDYLCRLGKTLQSSDWRLVAYALMDSHLHLAMISGAQTFSDWIHPLNTAFAQAVNRKRRMSGKKTLGPVFAERPTSKVYGYDVAINIISYIHNNPGRAGIVTNPALSPWTSHRSYLGLQKRPDFLDVKLGLHLCGLGLSDIDRHTFHDLVCARANHEVEARACSCDVVDPGSTDSIVVLNSTKIVEPALVTTCHKSISCTDVARLVSEHLDIDYNILMSRCRRRDIVAARRLSPLVWKALSNRNVSLPQDNPTFFRQPPE